MARKVLLVSGIVSSLLYTAMLVVVPMFWQGYSSASQAVSELSAIDAPSRSIWLALGIVWSLLYLAFGAGVRVSAGPSRALRLAGSVIFISAVVGLFWPPMHRREVLGAGGGTLTDTLHIAWAMGSGGGAAAALARE